jgi:hypothetical protein
MVRGFFSQSDTRIDLLAKGYVDPSHAIRRIVFRGMSLLKLTTFCVSSLGLSIFWEFGGIGPMGICHPRVYLLHFPAFAITHRPF